MDGLTGGFNFQAAWTTGWLAGRALVLCTLLLVLLFALGLLLSAGVLALAFVGASDKESVATIKRLEAKFGDEWVNEWLAGRGLNLNNYLEAA